MSNWKVYERGGFYRIGRAELLPPSTIGPSGEKGTYLVWHNTPARFGPEPGPVFESFGAEYAFIELDKMNEQIEQSERFKKDHWKHIVDIRRKK